LVTDMADLLAGLYLRPILTRVCVPKR
jgi:hypothetical protein